MTDDTAVSPDIIQALTALEAYCRSQHDLFRQIPVTPKGLRRGAVQLEVTLPATFADNGSIHSGLYTILLDTILAISAWSRMDVFQPLATINLKTDVYERVAPDSVVFCETQCDAIVDEIAFCHGKLSTLDGHLIAHAAGTFMVGTSKKGAGSRL